MSEAEESTPEETDPMWDRLLALATDAKPADTPRAGRPDESPRMHYGWTLYASGEASTLVAPLERVVEPEAEHVQITFRWLAIDVRWHAAGQTRSTTLQAYPGAERVQQLEQLFIMLASCVQRGAAARASNRTLVAAILALVGEEMITPTMQEGGATDKRRQSFLAIRSYLLDNLHRPFTAEAVAKDLHFSTNYLNRLCQTFVGMSFTRFLVISRLERARNLVVTSKDRSIREVAAKSGFNSFSYFIKTFRLTYGVTPGELRSRYFGVGDQPPVIEAGTSLADFEILKPQPPGPLASAPESFPQHLLMLSSVSNHACVVCWITPTGESHALGLLPPGGRGRWNMGVSPGECIVLKGIDGGILAGYRMPNNAAQIIIRDDLFA